MSRRNDAVLSKPLRVRGEPAQVAALAPCTPYVPHIDILLQALRVQRERLNSRSKIAIDARLLRKLIETLVEMLPFSEQFYLDTYPDISAAVAAGQIPDLHRHYVETGYFEGRLGDRPQVDEAFYLSTYRDVAAAIARGETRSATEHYIRSGATEGRVPNPAMREPIDNWMAVLQDELTRTVVR